MLIVDRNPSHLTCNTDASYWQQSALVQLKSVLVSDLAATQPHHFQALHLQTPEFDAHLHPEWEYGSSCVTSRSSLVLLRLLPQPAHQPRVVRAGPGKNARRCGASSACMLYTQVNDTIKDDGLTTSPCNMYADMHSTNIQSMRKVAYGSQGKWHHGQMFNVHDARARSWCSSNIADEADAPAAALRCSSLRRRHSTSIVADTLDMVAKK